MTGVVVVGDIATDVVVMSAWPLAPGSDTPARIRFTGGGQGANTAAWLAWADVPTTLVGAVGADPAGEARLAELAAAGVRCAVVRRPDAATGSVLALVRDGDRTMLSDRGANATLTADDIDAALAVGPDARHLHLSAYTLLDAGSRGAGRRALTAARERGWTTSVDAASAAPLLRVGAAAFAEWVRGTDLLLANDDEAAAADGPAPLPGLVRCAAVTKRGALGAVWQGADGTEVHVDAVPTSVVDPTGAGDAFAAGLLRAWLAGARPDEALSAGTRLGAIAVGHLGARPPT